MKRTMNRILLSVVVMTMAGNGALAVEAQVGGHADGMRLEQAFVAPPEKARPWVYALFVNGNITKEGITADLEAMRRVGLGGLTIMECDTGAPQGPVAFMGTEWRELFRHTCREAQRLGLEINMFNCGGYSWSGGPWITPELSMQTVVWTKTPLAGPSTFDGIIAQPETKENHYRDIALFAYPAPAKEVDVPGLSAKSLKTKIAVPLSASFAKLPPESLVNPEKLVDLTAKLAPGGQLKWEVPKGDWIVLRIGHTSTGAKCFPAPKDGRGLESDKFSRKATETHFNGMLGKLIRDNQDLAGSTFSHVHFDSWEAGSQNWTPGFEKEFKRRRGYDPRPWLPVMAGVVTGDLERSERFLWDMRRTANDLYCDNLLDVNRELAQRNGLHMSLEAYGDGPFNDMVAAGRADRPMAEFWSWARGNMMWSCREMVSAAHVYGKPIVAAEAFTALDTERWLGHPGYVKELGDFAFSMGINQLVIHRYAMQPWVTPSLSPGMAFGPWGLHYERTQTWWEMSRPWHEYLARCQYLLQQGLCSTDICLVLPENSPEGAEMVQSPDRAPYGSDLCPAEVVISRMSVRDGRIMLPDGMSYRLLVLPPVPTMTPGLLKKVKELVEAGAVVMGNPPVKSPSLENYPACDALVAKLSDEIWGTDKLPAGVCDRVLGKGRVIWGRGIVNLPTNFGVSGFFEKARWIWFPEGDPKVSVPVGTRYFRHEFKIDSPVESARLAISADDRFECWINGKAIGKGEFSPNRCSLFNISTALRQGTNLIAVAVKNEPNGKSPAAGLAAALTVKFKDGRMQAVFTGPDWRTATNAVDGWNQAAVPAPDWQSATDLGPMGIKPWPRVVEKPGDAFAQPDVAVTDEIFRKMGLPPDFTCEGETVKTMARYIHRQVGDMDVYFVANKEPITKDFSCLFRVTGKRPEFWWPDSGRIQPIAQFESIPGQTRIPIRLDTHESVFVVFRGKTEAGSQMKEAGRPNGKKNWLEFKPVQELAGAWKVTFDPKWGGPDKPVVFEKLCDWSQHPDTGIKYYSGTAEYRKVFDLAEPIGSQLSVTGTNGNNNPTRLWLDLGRVEVMAEVKLNGKELGILWKPPFRVEVTDALKPGTNTLEVKVVNLWVNRQIGDEYLPEDSERQPGGLLKSWPQWLRDGKASPTGRKAFSTYRRWKKEDTLVESGLLGPVSLQYGRE